MLAITTGFRLGEVLGLLWKDIDFDKHTATVNQTLGHDNKLKANAKTNSSKRTILIPKATIEALRKHKITVNKNKMRFGSAYQDLDLINCSRYGIPIERGTMRKYLDKIILKAGLKRIKLRITNTYISTFISYIHSYWGY